MLFYFAFKQDNPFGECYMNNKVAWTLRCSRVKNNFAETAFTSRGSIKIKVFQEHQLSDLHGNAFHTHTAQSILFVNKTERVYVEVEAVSSRPRRLP